MIFWSLVQASRQHLFVTQRITFDALHEIGEMERADSDVGHLNQRAVIGFGFKLLRISRLDEDARQCRHQGAGGAGIVNDQ